MRLDLYEKLYFEGLPGFEKEPQDTMVYPGQIAYLSCTLPSPCSSLSIHWLKDEHPLILDDSRMTILPSGTPCLFYHIEVNVYLWKIGRCY